MRQIFLPLALAATLAMPAAAQEADPSEDGRSLIEDGARMLLDGLMKEAQPAMEGLRDMAERFGPQLRSFAEEMGPALAEILKDVDDLSVYAAPERLPNGDIIIRRKVPLEPDRERPQDDRRERPSPSNDVPRADSEIEI
ncbi:hypothetical protein ACEWPM_006540 [Roseovarius sp. S4756]|uniref:hypothetical protein n=1 Tax=Roseovarius maritimus TaxID=3342637 RepID=UPI0037294686